MTMKNNLVLFFQLLFSSVSKLLQDVYKRLIEFTNIPWPFRSAPFPTNSLLSPLTFNFSLLHLSFMPLSIHPFNSNLLNFIMINNGLSVA